MSELVRIDETTPDGVVRLALDAGKGNVLTHEVIVRLEEVFGQLGEQRDVRAIVLGSTGGHFSFGASVPEHVRGEVERMLPAFHRLFRTVARSGLPVCAAVRGRCLGGGLELALAAHHIVVADDAKLGVPEVTLGVFPPVAAAVLPLRCSQPTVDRLVGLGEIVDGREAVSLGLADECVASQEVDDAAARWAARYTKLSGIAVRFATRAARSWWDDALEERLAKLERTYLLELMKTHDAEEGIRAFMEKRSPDWQHR